MQGHQGRRVNAMGMELISTETQVDPRQQELFGNDPSFARMLRSRAARLLAEKTIEASAKYLRIEPSKEELKVNPFAPVRHRWYIGLQRDMTEIEARQRQMDDARRVGIKEAADFLRSQKEFYKRADGFCKHVLVNQLDTMADRLCELADMP